MRRLTEASPARTRICGAGFPPRGLERVAGTSFDSGHVIIECRRA